MRNLEDRLSTIGGHVERHVERFWAWFWPPWRRPWVDWSPKPGPRRSTCEHGILTPWCLCVDCLRETSDRERAAAKTRRRSLFDATRDEEDPLLS